MSVFFDPELEFGDDQKSNPTDPIDYFMDLFEESVTLTATTYGWDCPACEGRHFTDNIEDTVTCPDTGHMFDVRATYHEQGK